jgi:hypothetical protein
MAVENTEAARSLAGEAQSLVRTTSDFKIGETRAPADGANRASGDAADLQPASMRAAAPAFDGNAALAAAPIDDAWEEF